MSNIKELIYSIEAYASSCHDFNNYKALISAKESGVLKNFRFIRSEINHSEHMGYDIEKIYEIDEEWYIAIYAYVSTSRNRDIGNRLNRVYEVEPYGKIITEWRVKNEQS